MTYSGTFVRPGMLIGLDLIGENEFYGQAWELLVGFKHTHTFHTIIHQVHLYVHGVVSLIAKANAMFLYSHGGHH